MFFEKKYDSAKAAFNKLIVDYPEGYFVNDALQLMLLLEAASGADDLLYDYSNALLFEQRRRYDSMAVVLERIAVNENPALADVALYRLALLSLDRFDSTSALGFVDRLQERLPESYYLPYGLKIKADILLTSPDTEEAGREIFRHLLEAHPNYPFTSEVRKRLRELELDRRTG